MAHTCSECTYMEEENKYNDGKFWCDWKREYLYANEIECYKFCEAYSRPNRISRSMYDYSISKQSNNGCFITTIVCEILKMPDNNPYLNTLRNFRRNVLQKDNKYKELLVHYDIVGPLIADKLRQDHFKEYMAQNVFETGIKPVVESISKKENLKAIELYTNMTKHLIKFYKLDGINPTKIEVENADITKSGHGIYKKLLVNE